MGRMSTLASVSGRCSKKCRLRKVREGVFSPSTVGIKLVEKRYN